MLVHAEVVATLLKGLEEASHRAWCDRRRQKGCRGRAERSVPVSRRKGGKKLTNLKDGAGTAPVCALPRDGRHGGGGYVLRPPPGVRCYRALVQSISRKRAHSRSCSAQPA